MIASATGAKRQVRRLIAEAVSRNPAEARISKTTADNFGDEQVSRGRTRVALIKRPVNDPVEKHGCRAREHHADDHQQKNSRRGPAVRSYDQRSKSKREREDRMRKTNQPKKSANWVRFQNGLIVIAETSSSAEHRLQACSCWQPVQTASSRHDIESVPKSPTSATAEASSLTPRPESATRAGLISVFLQADRVPVKECLLPRVMRLVCFRFGRFFSWLFLSLQPFGVEDAGLVGPLVGVRAEIVALGLEQVGREAGAAVLVVIGQRRAEPAGMAMPFFEALQTARRQFAWLSTGSHR